jgi:hypothetical protein
MEGRRPIRDRLTGRTPRSERGDRGSTPCPGARRGRIAQLGERLSYKQEVAGSTPALPTRTSLQADGSAAEHLSDTQRIAGSTPAPPIARGCSSAVERSPETRGAAGSNPAGHAFGLVAQSGEPPTLNRCGAGSSPAEATRLEGLPQVRYPVSKTGGPEALGVRFPPLPLEAWPRG